MQRAAFGSVGQPHWSLFTSATSAPLLVNWSSDAVCDKAQPDNYRYIHYKAQPGYKLYTVPRNSVSSTSSAIEHVCDASSIVSSCIMSPMPPRPCQSGIVVTGWNVGLVGKKHSKPVDSTLWYLM
jgi:hypothetical protein